MNNSIKAILMIFFGAFLGLYPLTSLLMNGLALGYLATFWTQTEDGLMKTVVTGILPHGIIEIPAIILACAYGIRFGGLLLKSLFNIVFRGRREQARREMVHWFRMSLPLMIVVVSALLVAAVIESTFTYWLVGR